MPAALVTTPDTSPVATTWPFFTAKDVSAKAPEKDPPPGTVPTTGTDSDDEAAAAGGAAAGDATMARATAAAMVVRRNWLSMGSPSLLWRRDTCGRPRLRQSTRVPEMLETVKHMLYTLKHRGIVIGWDPRLAGSSPAAVSSANGRGRPWRFTTRCPIVPGATPRRAWYTRNGCSIP